MQVKAIMTNKSLALIPALLFFGILLLMQWQQTEDVLIYLEPRIYQLEVELYQIDMVRRNRAAVEADRIAINNQVAMLLKRLPAELSLHNFFGQLAGLFRERGVELSFEYAAPVDKEFYQEITLQVQLNGRKLSATDLSEIFNKIERLVHWEADEQNQVLSITLYRSLPDLDRSRPKPCRTIDYETLSIWPFGSRIVNRVGQFNEKCVRRNQGEMLLNEANELQHQRRIMETRSRIIAELEKIAYHN